MAKSTSLTALISQKFRERTIAGDLALRLILGLSVTFLCAGMFSFVVQTRGEIKDLRFRLNSSAQQLANLMSMPMWTFNELEIKALAGSHGMSEEISRITVFDDTGAAVTEIRKNGRSLDLHAVRPILYKGRAIGKIRLSASTTVLYQRALQSLLSTAVLTGLAILTLIGMILPLLYHYLDVPLSRLISGIQRIASGQYRERFPRPPQRELARITDEVNFMAEKIDIREHQIRESMREATILRTEIGIAESIQKSMTATQGLNTARRIAQIYQPLDNLSGDWMTVFECDKGRGIYAIVGDVTGHGIPQGLVTMAAFGSMQTLRPIIQQNSRSFTPAGILNILRTTLVTILHECGLAMTISILKIDIENRVVTISSAGHPLPLISRPTKDGMKVLPLTAKAQSPLGYELLTSSAAPDVYVDSQHKLEQDDTILLFSDGLTEAKGDKNKPFQKTLIKTLRNLDRRLPPSVLLDRIMAQFQNHLHGGRTSDDVCLMVIDTRKEDNREAAA